MARRNRRQKNYQQDAQRFSENLFNTGLGRTIRDRQTFNRAVKQYLEGDISDKSDKKFIDQAFQEFRRKHPQVRGEKERPERREAQIRFDIAATIKGKTVRARRTMHTFKGKKFTVFRDKSGRFAKRR